MDIGSYDGGLQPLDQRFIAPQSPARKQLDVDFAAAGPSSWSLRQFDIGRPLGKGHFGKVYLARTKPPAEPFILVLKCLSKDEMVMQNVQKQVRREIDIMQQLRHPNIIRLYGWFHDAHRIFLMLELAGQGELYKHLAKAGRFSERRSSKYIRETADGLAYLHSKHIIHRDIKPENLLLGSNGEIKIGDFGWSVHDADGDGSVFWNNFDGSTSTDRASQHTLAGTLSYVAPEIVLGRAYNEAVDIWAIGVLAYEFLCGEEPFGSAADEGNRGEDSGYLCWSQAKRAVVQSRICRCDVQYPGYLSHGAKDFISRLLRLKPEERMPLRYVPDHPWISQHSADAQGLPT